MSVSDRVYDTWLTKTQAAESIGVTTKTVERLAAAGTIQQARHQPQGRGPTLAVYHPDDVARIALERRTAPSAFVLPAGVTSPVHGNGHRPAEALALAAPEVARSGEELLRAFAVALRQMSETSETPAALFLTLDEAAEVSGLSRTALQNMIASGMLQAVKDRGWKIRRRDLERV